MVFLEEFQTTKNLENFPEGKELKRVALQKSEKLSSPTRTSGLNYSLSIHLHPYLVNERDKGSDETV